MAVNGWERHFQVSGLGYRYGYRYGNRFGNRARDLYLYPNLNTRTRHLMAETRNLKVCFSANHPVSGFPLSW